MSRRYTLLSLAALLFIASLLGGTLSILPLVWDDSPHFIGSALRSLATGEIQLNGNANLGYVLVIATLLAAGAGFSALILVQHGLWAFSVAFLGFTLIKLTRSNWAALPVLFIAGYPGIQIYQNLVLTESFYTSALTLSLCFLLHANHAKEHKHVAFYIVGSLFFAVITAFLKAQGLAPFAALVLCNLFVAVRTSVKTLAVCSIAVALSFSFVAYAQGVRNNSQDQTAAVFGSKTLFCTHLNLILETKSISASVRESFGEHAANFLTKLAESRVSTSGEFKTLGFYSDACQFDQELDRLAMHAEGRGVEGLANWYRKAFLHAVAERPLLFLWKIIRQTAYGLAMSIPPHGLDKTLAGADPTRAATAILMSSYGRGVENLDQSGPITAPFLAASGFPASMGYRLISVLTALGLVWSLAGLLVPRWRRIATSTGAALASIVWFSQIGGVAIASTLDIWRYIVPAVPAAVVAVTLAIWTGANLVRTSFFFPGARTGVRRK